MSSMAPDSALPRPPAYHQPAFIPPPLPRRRRRSCCLRCFCCCCCFLLILILLFAGAITAFTLWLSPSLPSMHLNHLNPSNNGTMSLSLSVKNPNVRPVRFIYRAMNVRVTSKDGELVGLGTVPGFSQERRNTTGLKVNAKVVDVKEMKKEKVVNVWVDCYMDVLFQGVKSGEFGVTWFCDQVDVPTSDQAAAAAAAADGRQCVLMFNFSKYGWPVK